MTDNDIINDLSNRKQIKWKFLDNNIKQYLLNRYDDNYSSCEKLILKESYYRILNNIENVQCVLFVVINVNFYILVIQKLVDLQNV